MITDNKTLIKALKIIGGIMMAITVGTWGCFFAGKALGTTLLSSIVWTRACGICGLALWEIGTVMSKMGITENGISRRRGMLSVTLMALGAIMSSIAILVVSFNWLFWLSAALFFIGLTVGEADNLTPSPQSDNNS